MVFGLIGVAEKIATSRPKKGRGVKATPVRTLSTSSPVTGFWKVDPFRLQTISSGRLLVWDKDGNPIEPELEPSIELVEDPSKGVSGPLWVRGGIPIESADGTTYEIRNRITLCRCGKSENKPFCDGIHLRK